MTRERSGNVDAPLGGDDDPVIYGPKGEELGKEDSKPGLLDPAGVPLSKGKKEEKPEDQEEKVEPKPAGPPEMDDDIQSKIDPVDHAIAEMITMRPAITNVELGQMFDLHEETIGRRRGRPLFVRYMIFLRKPSVDIIHSAGKKASQRLVEALDYMKWVTRKDPKTGKMESIREPDPWVRLAAIRLVTEITIAKNSRGGAAPGGGQIPGVPQDEVPDLAQAFIATFRQAEVVKRKKLGPGKKSKKKEK